MQQYVLEHELVKYKERLQDEVHKLWKAQTRAAIQAEVGAAGVKQQLRIMWNQFQLTIPSPDAPSGAPID